MARMRKVTCEQLGYVHRWKFHKSFPSNLEEFTRVNIYYCRRCNAPRKIHMRVVR